MNNSITLNQREDRNGNEIVALTLAYKVAAEIGSLGDNVKFLRQGIRNDSLLQLLVTFPFRSHTVLAHTRWASVGAISEANCHPVDNQNQSPVGNGNHIIHVCLNGDIDNFQELKKEQVKKGRSIPVDISTDTKIIPPTD